MEPNPEWLRDRAREMRKHPTPAERTFWRALKGGKMGGLKFRRQVPIGSYIVDFCCHTARVIVEFDGDSHIGREAEDLARKEWLEEQGYRVLRFGTEIVHWSDAEILGEIYLACRCALSEGDDPFEMEGTVSDRNPLSWPLPRRREEPDA